MDFSPGERRAMRRLATYGLQDQSVIASLRVWKGAISSERQIFGSTPGDGEQQPQSRPISLDRTYMTQYLEDDFFVLPSSIFKGGTCAF